MTLKQSTIDRLPNELLCQIFSYLDIEPPSLARLNRSPSIGIARSETKDLKSVSVVSRRLREVALPFVFSHTCLDLEDEADFLTYILRSGLSKSVRSIVVTQSGSVSNRDNEPWWHRILRFLDPQRLTVVATTTFMGSILGSPDAEAESWAFDIPLQILHLEQNSRRDTPWPQLELDPQLSILSCRAWTSLLFNEGSSLRAYNHYEYFHYQVPSPFNRWGPVSWDQPNAPRPEIRHVLGRLTSFHYIAVFPFYNHVSRVMTAVGMMTSLLSLHVQLAPALTDNFEMELKSSLDPSDPWMELETGYSIISYTVANHGLRLGEFVASDYGHLRSELSSIIGGVLDSNGWVHDKQGTWNKVGTSV